MRVYKKVMLVIFAIMIIALAVLVMLLPFGVIGTADIVNLVNKITSVEKIWIVSISIIVILLAVLAIFSSDADDESIAGGLAIKHDKGTVYIAKNTFESIILNVSLSFASLKNIKVVVGIDELGVSANVFAYMLPDTVIDSVTLKLQENIKEAVLKQTTVEMKDINVKIKGVYVEAEKVKA